MNVVLYSKGSDDIWWFVENCIKTGRNFFGSNVKLAGVSLDLYDFMWTADTASLIQEDPPIWDKKVSEMTESQDTNEVIVHPASEISEAEKMKALISGLSFQQLDAYIDNNVIDLLSAKEFLKKLAKVTLGVIKIMDREK